MQRRQMAKRPNAGWRTLLEGYPRLRPGESHPIRAYSEFMPARRLVRRPYGESGRSPFSPRDDHGWHISEIEEEYQLRPGMAALARQIVSQLRDLGEGKPAYLIAGHQGRNLKDNPYWPAELAAHAGKLAHERYVTLLPLAFSRTQDDKGRDRWTFFGGSEQGPEQAIWQSLYSAPGRESVEGKALHFLVEILSRVFGESCRKPSDLRAAGLRIFPTPPVHRFPFWNNSHWPSYLEPLIVRDGAAIGEARYLLTFAPFSVLPEAARRRYLSGDLVLLPFPGSLVFWGVSNYIRLQREFPLAMQLPLQRLVARREGPEGVRVPQSGWFHEPAPGSEKPPIDERLLFNVYRRTSRWDRVERNQDELILGTIEDRVAKTLFRADLPSLGLYKKPLARNSQIFSEDTRVLLNGPEATRADIENAARAVGEGGIFRYRFQFPPMQVGNYDVYWQRPLVAFSSGEKGEPTILEDGPAGYFTAYKTGEPELVSPLRIWPRFKRRPFYLMALRNYEHLEQHYRHQTALNVVRLLDLSGHYSRKPVPRSLARQILTLAQHESLESWLAALPDKAKDKQEGGSLREELERRLESEPGRRSGRSITPVSKEVAPSADLTFGRTATRRFEKAWWRDIATLSAGAYVNKNNGDCVEDEPTLKHLKHRRRDLEAMGDYLLKRHRQAIADSGMAGRAFCGEVRFSWETDHNFEGFGGWKNDQDGRAYERDLIVVIPGRSRKQAVIMADHYDTAYMEDVFEPSLGGDGARVAARGADDNCSATATLLQASPILLEMSRKGLLKRDVWLVHLTGEEFPADCMGARALCQALIQRTLRVHANSVKSVDLSATLVVGAYILDMIGHNLETQMDVFEIAPGESRGSLDLARHAHLANEIWNSAAQGRNLSSERKGKGRGRRSANGGLPEIAAYPQLRGEIRLPDDPRSSLYNTDAQILSDCGVPVVLLMEDYDIARSGYHDSKDTLANIDLDYGSALAAIAIESVARAATE